MYILLLKEHGKNLSILYFPCFEYYLTSLTWIRNEDWFMGILTLAVPGQVVARVLQVLLDQVLVEVVHLGVPVNIPDRVETVECL